MSCQKPYICEKNRIKRVKWAKEHKNLTVDQWRKVFWTDESPFVLQENCKKRYGNFMMKNTLQIA
jgi:hypothetical protein